MAKTTRLYQRARSPLIEGRSKVARPAPLDIAVSSLIVLVVVSALEVLPLAGASAPGVALAARAGRLGAMAAGGIAGACAGVLAGRAWGSRRSWVPGTVTALLVVAVAWFVGR